MISFLRAETPQGLACLTITVPVFFGILLDIANADNISF